MCRTWRKNAINRELGWNRNVCLIFIQNALLPWQRIVKQWWNIKFAYLCTIMGACAEFKSNAQRLREFPESTIFLYDFHSNFALPWQHNDQQWRKVKFAHIRTTVVRCAEFQAKCSKTEGVGWVHMLFGEKKCCFHGNALFNNNDRLSLNIYILLKWSHVPNFKPNAQKLRELTESTIFLHDFIQNISTVTMATHWSTMTKDYVCSSTYYSGRIQISS